MIRRESNFQTLFRHWLKANPRETAAFELKQTQKESMAFSAVADHQIAALLAAKRSGILYKIPDDSRGIKPFDMVYLKGVLAFVVIKYPSFFCLIDVDNFMQELVMGGRKSLTALRARQIAAEIVDL